MQTAQDILNNAYQILGLSNKATSEEVTTKYIAYAFPLYKKLDKDPSVLNEFFEISLACYLILNPEKAGSTGDQQRKEFSIYIFNQQLNKALFKNPIVTESFIQRANETLESKVSNRFHLQQPSNQ